ncbi:MAG: hypothetical protein ACR2GH_01785 [Pseudonocardia sp.]
MVIGEELFTIMITAGSAAARVDWRADFDALTYQWVDTPPELAHGVRAYMKTLGLAYAALDFRRAVRVLRVQQLRAVRLARSPDRRADHSRRGRPSP